MRKRSFGPWALVGSFALLAFACSKAIPVDYSPTDDGGSSPDGDLQGDGSSGKDGSHPSSDSGGSGDGGGDEASGGDGGIGFDGGSSDGGGSGDGSSCTGTAIKVPDAGTADAGGCAIADAGVCAPGSVASYSPTWTPPTAAHQNLCSATDISTIYADCFDPMTSNATTCGTDQTTYAACFGCLITKDTDPKWGPTIESSNGLININVAGCIANAETCNTDCAKAVQGYQGCLQAACDTQCGTITTTMQLTDYETCQSNAASCQCENYVAPANCQNELTDGGAAATDCNATDFKTYFTNVGTLFCGK